MECSKHKTCLQFMHNTTKGDVDRIPLQFPLISLRINVHVIFKYLLFTEYT